MTKYDVLICATCGKEVDKGRGSLRHKALLHWADTHHTLYNFNGNAFWVTYD